MCAKHYENKTMLSRVTAKMSGMFFLRHTVINLGFIVILTYKLRDKHRVESVLQQRN